MAARKSVKVNSNRGSAAASTQKRRARKSSAGATTHLIPSIAPAIQEAIEVERERLMRAHTLLSCAAVAMDAEELSFDGPHYVTVIEMALHLVNRAINNLESASLESVGNLQGDSVVGLDADIDELNTVPRAFPRASGRVREPLTVYQLH